MRTIGAVLLVSLGLLGAFACRREGEAVTNDGTKPKKKNASVKTKAPQRHREKHEDCSAADTPPKSTTTFKPSAPIAPGPPCKSKSDCSEKPNGRCSAGNCTYDSCYKDGDCKTGVCTCQEEGKRGWYCKPGNCAVDGDCGDNAYCSPTWDLDCGSFIGVTGWYCHAPADECTDDDDCTDKPGGYCAWSSEKKHWVCGYGMCEG